MITSRLEAVLALHRRGYALIPVPFKQKRPVLADWQDLRFDESDLPKVFAQPSNVGVLLGTPSGEVVDVDLDCPKAQALAPALLPATNLRSGRTSAPDSHWFYRVGSPLKTTKFIDPAQGSGNERAMLVELRSTGAQTLVPPSVHPSGEAITWVEDGEPAEIDGDALRQAVARLAAASLLVRAWPPVGSRHEAALALGGGLLRAGWEFDATANLVGHIAWVAGDEEAEDRRQAVRSTADTLAAGQHTTGWPTLVTLLDHRVVAQVQRWLGTDQPDVAASRANSAAPPPPFPVDVFPPAIATFVQRGAAAFGIPPDFIAVPLLGLAAGVIGRLREIELKSGWTERAILWTGVVGRPGSGKSPGMDYAQQLVNDLQQTAWNAYQAAMAAWKEHELAAKTGAGTGGERQDPPVLESFYTTDATIEAIAALVDASPGICLIRDELVGWVKAHDAYRQAGDRQTWLSLWAGSALKIDRKTAPPLYIPTPSVSVTGGLQPDRLSDLRDAAHRDDGFVDRLLLAWPAAPVLRWTDHEVDPAIVRAAQDLFATLRSRPDGARRQVSRTRFDPAARDRFVAWHDANAELVAHSVGLVGGWAAKYPRQVARLALVLHALHHPDEPLVPVTVEIIDGAITLVEYFRSHLPLILAHLGQSSTATGSAGLVSRVAALLRAAGGAWVSRTALHAGLGRNAPAQTLTEALAQLVEEGVVERRLVPTEGRPREEYCWGKNEETKKGSAGRHEPASGTPLFVSSFLRAEEISAICCLCAAPLSPGRRYVCESCAAGDAP
jgi:hypothetical protein